jgi:hypothetical protein
LWNYGQQRRAAIIDAALGDVAKAEALFADAVTGSKKRFGGANYDSAGSEEAWGLMLLAEGQPEKARPHLAAARNVHAGIATEGNRWLERLDAMLAVVDGLGGKRDAARAALDREIAAAEKAEDIFAARRARYWRARFSDDASEARALLQTVLTPSASRKAFAPLDVDAVLLLAELTPDGALQLAHLRTAISESARIWGREHPNATRIAQRATALRPDATVELGAALVEPTPSQDELAQLVAAIQAQASGESAAPK